MKLRNFHIRTQTVGVILEDDVELGGIYPIPVKKYCLNKSNYEVDVSHLENNKQVELHELLRKHAPLFSGKIQVANVGKQKIRL